MNIRRNILIFHQAALGDFIVTWPLALALARAFAQSRIIYVTHSQKGKLAERVLRVESADSEAGWHSLFADSPQLPSPAAKLLEGAQIVVSFGGMPGIPLAAPHAKIISLDTKLPGEGHVSEILMQQLDPMIATAMQQMLRSISSRGVGYRLEASNRIVIHPGAGKEANRWPAEKFLKLARRLQEEGKNVRVLLGETEIEKWSAELIRQFQASAEVHRPVTLLELLEEISAADIFVGNDSGPGHLAGIIGVPTISLFGASDPTRWRPLGPRAVVVRRQPIETIASEDVWRAIKESQVKTS
ncbi:MAG TPA: glycosyltransferase family 9 protein [Tepidisphaeraceae bacterium]